MRRPRHGAAAHTLHCSADSSDLQGSQWWWLAKAYAITHHLYQLTVVMTGAKAIGVAIIDAGGTAFLAHSERMPQLWRLHHPKQWAQHIDHTWVVPPCCQPPPGLYQAYQGLEGPSHRHLKRETTLSTITPTGCMYIQQLSECGDRAQSQ